MLNESPMMALRKRIIRTPRAVTTLTDRQLSALLRGPPDAARHDIVAESLFRRWLYGARCPEDILHGIETKVLSQTSNTHGGVNQLKAWLDLSMLIREHRDASLPDQSLLATEEKIISSLFARRVDDFRSSDGLIALVPKTGVEMGDGVVVAFKLEPGSGIVAADDSSLECWEEDLKLLRESYHWDMRVRVCAVFSPGFEASGRSLGLALVLARERLRGSLPWFDPLSVLATGKVADRRVLNVDEVPAKSALAERLGCTRFFSPRAATRNYEREIPDGTPVGNAIALVCEALPTFKLTSRAALEVIAKWQVEMELTERADTEVPEARRLEVQPLLTGAYGILAEDSTFANEAILALQLAENNAAYLWGEEIGHDIAEQEEFVVVPYQRRAIYGRRHHIDQIDSFVETTAGGLCFIKGNSGYGKTALIAHWLARKHPCARFTHFFRTERERLRNSHNFFVRLGLFLQSVLPKKLLLGSPPVGSGPELAVSRLLRTYARVPPTERPRLYLVIDGLDEASPKYFPNFFPFSSENWPAGLYVIVSARTPGSADIDELRTWKSATSKEILVDRLDEKAISDWLRAYPNPVLSLLADDPAFLSKLYERSQGEGCALYIQHILEDLAAFDDIQHNWRSHLEQMPQGYIDLIAFQYRKAFDLGGEAIPKERINVFRKLVHLLAVARGPLDGEDINQLLNTDSVPEIAELPRWIETGAGDAKRGARFWFANPLIQAALRSMRLPLESVENELIAYCLQWRQNRSPYALQYLIEHLEQVKDKVRIYAAASDDEFLRAQAERMTEDVKAPLRTLQTALRLAIDRRDINQTPELEKMVVFGRKHARWLSKISQECPCSALRQGNLRRATGLIENYENSEDQLLWHLLLSLTAIEGGRHALACDIIEEKLPKHLLSAQLGVEHSGAAVALCFLLMVKLTNLRFQKIIRVLSPAAQEDLCRMLAEAGRFERARAIVPYIRNQRCRDHARLTILRAHLRTLGADRDAETLAHEIESPIVEDWARAEFAKTALRKGRLEVARHLLEAVSRNHLLQRIEILCSIAEQHARWKHSDAAFNALQDATDEIRKDEERGKAKAVIATDLMRGRAIARLAVCEARLGRVADARRTLGAAIDTIKKAEAFSAPKAECMFEVARLVERHFGSSHVFLHITQGALAIAAACLLENSEDTNALEYKSQLVFDIKAPELARLYCRFWKQGAAVRVVETISSEEQRILASAAVVDSFDYIGRALPLRFKKKIGKRGQLGANAVILQRLALSRESDAVDLVRRCLLLRAPHSRAEKWGQPRLRAALAVASAKHRAVAKAREMLDGAETSVRTEESEWNLCWALLNLAEANADSGFGDKARQLLSEIPGIAQRDTIEHYARLLCEVAQTQARHSFLNDASQTFNTALTVIDTFSASQASDAIIALGELIEAQSKAGLFDDAWTTLGRGKQLLGQMNWTRDGAWTAAALLALSVAKSVRYVPAFKTEAHELLQSARSALQSATSRQRAASRTDPLAAINRVSAFLHAYEGDIETALEDAAQVRDRALRSTTIRDIAIVCIDQGRRSDVLPVISLMTNRRSELLPDVAAELARTGARKEFDALFFLAASYLDAFFRMSASMVQLYNPTPSVISNIETVLSLDAPPPAAI